MSVSVLVTWREMMRESCLLQGCSLPAETISSITMIYSLERNNGSTSRLIKYGNNQHCQEWHEG